ncbi:MAG: hypothetical protein QM207_05050, partial [Thermobispora sp.]|nr:hypothetical protein [Thermobispora sp.]
SLGLGGFASHMNKDIVLTVDGQSEAVSVWGSTVQDALEVLAERLAPLGVPVLAGLPVGHGAPQFPVWLEAPAVLDTASRTLTSAAGPAGTPG